MFCYKIVFGLVSVKLDDFFEIIDLFRGQEDKLFKSRCTIVPYVVNFSPNVLMYRIVGKFYYVNVISTNNNSGYGLFKVYEV